MGIAIQGLVTFDHRSRHTFCRESGGIGGYTKGKFFPVTSCYIGEGGLRSLIARIKIGDEDGLVCLLEIFQRRSADFGNDGTLYAVGPCKETARLLVVTPYT